MITITNYLCYISSINFAAFFIIPTDAGRNHMPSGSGSSFPRKRRCKLMLGEFHPIIFLHSFDINSLSLSLIVFYIFHKRTTVFMMNFALVRLSSARALHMEKLNQSGSRNEWIWFNLWLLGRAKPDEL